MIKGIAFDKDGTVLDYQKFWVPVAENAVKLLIKDGDIKEVLDAIGVYDGINGVLCYGTYKDVADKINEVHKGKKFSQEEIENAFKESLKTGKIVAACKDIKKVFTDIKEKGFKITLITNDTYETAKICLNELGITEFFDKIYADDYVNPPKPNPYYLNKMAEDFNIKTSEIAMVGDTLTDVSFGKNANSLTFGIGLDEADVKINDISYVLGEVLRINGEEV